MKKLFFIVGVLFLALPSVSFASTTVYCPTNTATMLFATAGTRSVVAYAYCSGFAGIPYPIALASPALSPATYDVYQVNGFEMPGDYSYAQSVVFGGGGNFVVTDYFGLPPATCTSFTYSDWSTCADSLQSRTVATSSPSGCVGGSSGTLSQSCEMPPAVVLTSSLFETFLLSLRNNSLQIIILIISLSSLWYVLKLVKKFTRGSGVDYNAGYQTGTTDSLLGGYNGFDEKYNALNNKSDFAKGYQNGSADEINRQETLVRRK